jgi:hypothetical protein
MVFSRPITFNRFSIPEFQQQSMSYQHIPSDTSVSKQLDQVSNMAFFLSLNAFSMGWDAVMEKWHFVHIYHYSLNIRYCINWQGLPFWKSKVTFGQSYNSGTWLILVCVCAKTSLLTIQTPTVAKISETLERWDVSYYPNAHVII